MNSDVNKFASLLNTSKLYLWYQRSDCIDTFKSSSNSLVDVAHHFLIKNRIKPSTADNDKIKNIIDETNNDSLIGFLKDEDYENMNDETFMYTNYVTFMQGRRQHRGCSRCYTHDAGDGYT
jgi:hypothetical protein